MRKRILHLGASLAFLLTLVAAPATVFAEGGTGGSGSGSHSGDDTTETHTTTTTNSNETENETETHNTETRTGSDRSLSDNQQHRLDGNKLKVCEKRQTTIKSIMSRSTERAQKQIDLFGTITTRVENFYTSKGKTLSNYDELVAAVNSAKTQAETDLATLKNTTFSCDGSDPKGAATAFKTALQKEIQDLKAYRTAVKNLIVGVKSVQSTTEGSNR
jgi:hypothetical protein